MKSRKAMIFAEAVFYTAFLSVLVGSAAYSGYNAGTLVENVDPENSSESKMQSQESEDEEEAEYRVFEATAYCDFGITYSGVLVQRGIVAADPEVLPIGSVIQVKAGDYSGIYTVMDTGGVVKGRIIDIYMPDYEEAIQFGRQTVGLRVIRKGWNPETDEKPPFFGNSGTAVAG
jgi:3D (Asp-Asp-Asp) domain-containing protein